MLSQQSWGCNTCTDCVCFGTWSSWINNLALGIFPGLEFSPQGQANMSKQKNWRRGVT